jgi:hypothetical protein
VVEVIGIVVPGGSKLNAVVVVDGVVGAVAGTAAALFFVFDDDDNDDDNDDDDIVGLPIQCKTLPASNLYSTMAGLVSSSDIKRPRKINFKVDRGM